MSRPTPRRPSRTTTPKPRKIAGRDVPPSDGGETPPEADRTAPAAAPPKPAAAETTPPRPPRPPRPQPVVKGGDDGDGRSSLGGARTTFVLLAVVAVCVLLLVLQGIWFFVHADRNEERVAASSSSKSDDDGSEPIAVPSGRPVVLNEAAVQEGVDAAASAAQLMFARSYKNYDDGVADAVKLMTSRFAEEYRTTTDDVRDEFIKKKTQVEVRVVAQSVVRANDSELQALIFLNQYVIRGQGDEAKTTYTPYRALLTMVHTDTGWLVDDLDTK